LHNDTGIVVSSYRQGHRPLLVTIITTCHYHGFSSLPLFYGAVTVCRTSLLSGAAPLPQTSLFSDTITVFPTHNYFLSRHEALLLFYTIYNKNGDRLTQTTVYQAINESSDKTDLRRQELAVDPFLDKNGNRLVSITGILIEII
ncbi:hypothetical protein TNCT_208721, partial [Trichonephila clavata]